MNRFLILSSGRIIAAPIDSNISKEIQVVDSLPDSNLEA
jgi:hypothetical protein